MELYDVSAPPLRPEDADDRLDLFFNAKRQRVHPEDPDNPGEEVVARVTYFLRYLRGADYRAANDTIIAPKKKGQPQIMSGTSTRTKVCRAVMHVEGLSIAGREVHRLTEKDYDLLDAPNLTALTKKVQEMNGETDEDADEDFEKPSED